MVFIGKLTVVLWLSSKGDKQETREWERVFVYMLVLIVMFSFPLFALTCMLEDV